MHLDTVKLAAGRKLLAEALSGLDVATLQEKDWVALVAKVSGSLSDLNAGLVPNSDARASMEARASEATSNRAQALEEGRQEAYRQARQEVLLALSSFIETKDTLGLEDQLDVPGVSQALTVLTKELT